MILILMDVGSLFTKVGNNFRSQLGIYPLYDNDYINACMQQMQMQRRLVVVQMLGLETRQRYEQIENRDVQGRTKKMSDTSCFSTMYSLQFIQISQRVRVRVAFSFLDTRQLQTTVCRQKKIRIFHFLHFQRQNQVFC